VIFEDCHSQTAVIVFIRAVLQRLLWNYRNVELQKSIKKSFPAHVEKCTAPGSFLSCFGE